MRLHPLEQQPDLLLSALPPDEGTAGSGRCEADEVGLGSARYQVTTVFEFQCSIADRMVALAAAEESAAIT